MADQDVPEDVTSPNAPQDGASEYSSFGTKAADRFAALVGRGRFAVAALLATLTAVSVYGLTRLGFDPELRNLFEADAGEMQSLDTLHRQFGGDDNVVLVVLDAGEVFSPVAVRALRRLDKSLQAIEGVSSVTSLADMVVSSRAEVGFDATLPWPFPKLSWAPRFKLPYATTQPLLPPFDAAERQFRLAKQRAEDRPLVEGWMLSESEGYALLIVNLDPGLSEIKAVRPRIDAVRQRVESTLRDTHLSAYVTGVPAARLALLEAMKKEQVAFTIAGIAVGAAVAGLIFRQLAAAVAVVAPAVVAPVWIMGLLGLAGGQINPINSVTPVLVVIIALADGVHVVHAVRRALGRGDEPQVAARAAVRAVGPACLLTCITTAIGFASLGIARVDAIQYFGLVTAGGVLLGALGVMTIIPLLCGYVFGLRVGGRGRKHEQQTTRLPKLVDHGFLQFPFAFATFGTIITVASAFLCQRLEPSTSFSGTLPRGSEARRGAALVDREFGGSLSLVALIEWDAALSAGHSDVVAAVRATEDAMKRTSTLSYPISYLDLLTLLPSVEEDAAPTPQDLSRLPRSLRERFVREDLRRAVVRARIPDHGSHRHMPVVRKLRERLAEVESRYAGIHIALSGTAVAVGENAAKMIHDLAFSLGVAAGVIWLVITLAARSWRLGLVAILPNVLPLALAGVWLVLAGHVLTITGVISFCVVLGIAVDDTIHMTHRYKRELASGEDIDSVLRRSFRTVGHAVVVTTVVFVAGMGILLLSDLPGLRMFGQIACVGLVAALVADLFLLPALLKLAAPYLPAAARRPWGGH